MLGTSRCLSAHLHTSLTPPPAPTASSAANLVIYSTLPLGRSALVAALLPVLRASMCITASRIMLNLRGVMHENVQMQQPPSSGGHTTNSLAKTSVTAEEFPMVMDITSARSTGGTKEIEEV